MKLVMAQLKQMKIRMRKEFLQEYHVILILQ